MLLIRLITISLKKSAKLLFVGCFFLTFSSQAQAPLDVRVALVIGNAAYINVPVLENSTNDAKSVSIVLRKLGFQVIEVEDGSKAQMEQAVSRLQNLLQGKQAVAMLYYAGHGLQLDWHNYMVPVDAKLSQVDDVPRQTIDIDQVISVLKKAVTRINIIVLDACRDNPFSGKVSGKGLAQLDAPVGTYLAFATAPGNVAEDGDTGSGNGLFTQYLLQELQRPAAIEDVFKRVRLQVRQKSHGRQIPWDSSSLEEDFSFNDGSKHTFNPEDLVREAREREEKLRAEAEAAKLKAIELAKEQELIAQRLAAAEQKKALEAQAQAREKELALAAAQEKQKALEAAQAAEKAKAEMERQAQEANRLKLSAEEAKAKEEQRLAEAQAAKLKEIELAKEQELIAQRLAEAQKKKELEAQAQAQALAKERERQFALALEQEKQRAFLAAQAAEKAKAEVAAQQMAIELAKAREVEEASRKKLSPEDAKEQQFAIEKAEWDRIKDSKNEDDFYAYLNKYPSGLISQQATFMLENLSKAKIVAQKDKNGVQQIVGEPRYRVGDVWVEAVIDDWTGVEQGRIQSRVVKIEKGLVYIESNAGQTIRTLDGAAVQITSDGGQSFDPPRIDLPGGEIAVGQKWSARCIQTNSRRSQWRDEDFKVVAFEEITTPAGNFKAFKIEATSIQQHGGRVSRSYWVEPGWGVPIKASRVAKPARGVATRETYLLVSRIRGPA
jgi:uncharacterized caspase-like protein